MFVRRKLRKTQQREVILEELRRSPAHPTAAELHEIVKIRLPRISLATVYRNLRLLAELGHIQTLQHHGGQTRFDGNPQRHYHVCCVRCGRVDDVHHPPPELGTLLTPATLGGYDILGYPSEFTGICPRCKGLEALATRPAAE